MVDWTDWEAQCVDDEMEPKSSGTYGWRSYIFVQIVLGFLPLLMLGEVSECVREINRCVSDKPQQH